jgi:hypothetical protein
MVDLTKGFLTVELCKTLPGRPSWRPRWLVQWPARSDDSISSHVKDI